MGTYHGEILFPIGDFPKKALLRRLKVGGKGSSARENQEQKPREKKYLKSESHVVWRWLLKIKRACAMHKPVDLSVD